MVEGTPLEFTAALRAHHCPGPASLPVGSGRSGQLCLLLPPLAARYFAHLFGVVG